MLKNISEIHLQFTGIEISMLPKQNSFCCLTIVRKMALLLLYILAQGADEKANHVHSMKIRE